MDMPRLAGGLLDLVERPRNTFHDLPIARSRRNSFRTVIASTTRRE